MNEYIAGLKNYVLFSGRATRRDYWMFALFNAIIYFAFVVVDNVIGTGSGTSGVFSLIYALATLLPSLGLGARRLHDTGRRGWLVVLAFIPLANLILIFLFAEQGKPGDNQYGPDPRALPVAG